MGRVLDILIYIIYLFPNSLVFRIIGDLSMQSFLSWRNQCNTWIYCILLWAPFFYIWLFGPLRCLILADVALEIVNMGY